jgi:hypothetical protein
MPLIESVVFLCDEETQKPGITELPEGLFFNCKYLKEFNIPKGITKIGYGAFYGTALTEITIPDDVEEIGNSAFADCNALTTVNFPKDSLKILGHMAFSSCEKLVNIEFPASVKEVGGALVSHCENLETVRFLSNDFGYLSTDTSTSVFAQMFMYCPKLKSVSFPGLSCDIIWGQEFITGSGNKETKSAKNVSLIRSVTFPPTVTGIGAAVNAGQGVFEYPDVMEELVMLQPQKLRLGNKLFYNFTETASLKKPLKRIVIMADETELKTTSSFYHNTYNYAGLSTTNKTTYSGRSPIAYIPRDTEIYVKPNSVTYQELVKNIGILNTYNSVYTSDPWTNPNFIFLTQPITLTAQDISGGTDLLAAASADVSYDTATSYGYPSGKDVFSDGGMTDTISADILRPYQISAFDALAALHAKQYGWAEGSGGEQLAVNKAGVITKAFDRDAANLALYVNGKRYANADIAKTQVGERDRVHFAFEPAGTVKLPAFYDETTQITELDDMTPGKEKRLRLYYVDVTDQDTDNKYKLADTDVYSVDFETGEATKIGATDENGDITLMFTANGQYHVTAADPEGGIVHNFLTVNVYAPDTSLEGDPAVSGEGIEPGVKLKGGHTDGELVSTGGNAYTLYVNDAAGTVTLTLRPAYDGTGTITLTDVDDEDNPYTMTEDGAWEVPIDISGVGTTVKLKVEIDEAEYGKEEREYTVTVVTSPVWVYSGLTGVTGTPGESIGTSSTLRYAFDPEAETQNIVVLTHPGQQSVKLAVTAKAGTQVKIGDETQTPDEASDGTSYYTLDIGVADGQKITSWRADMEDGFEYPLNFARRSTVAGVYTPDGVTEYRPANMQDGHLNALLSPFMPLYGRTHIWDIVLLGQHGGYATYYYDQPITDDPNNPYGVDFIVYGNAFQGGMANEPGGVQVSENGTKWYHLAGQRHYELTTRHEQNVPLLSGTYGSDPREQMTFDGGTTDSLLILRIGDPGFAGGYPDGVDWGYADVANSSTDENADTLWYVDAKPYNPYREDSITSYADGGNVGDMFDLAWAVDDDGKPVKLEKGIRFIKVQNVADIKENSAFGEVSPEICAITRVNPANVGTVPVLVTEAPKVFTIGGVDILNHEDIEKIGENTYYLDGFDLGGKTPSVHIEGAEDDNVYINKEAYYGGTANYNGLCDADRTRTVRVVVQNGEREPLIYVVGCVNGEAPAYNTDLLSVIAHPGDEKLELDDDGRYIWTVGHTVPSIELKVQALNPEAKISLSGAAVSGGSVDLTHGEYSAPFTLTDGLNAFTLRVTSADGKYSSSYDVVILRDPGYTLPQSNDTVSGGVTDAAGSGSLVGGGNFDDLVSAISGGDGAPDNRPSYIGVRLKEAEGITISTLPANLTDTGAAIEFWTEIEAKGLGTMLEKGAIAVNSNGEIIANTETTLEIIGATENVEYDTVVPLNAFKTDVEKPDNSGGYQTAVVAYEGALEAFEGVPAWKIEIGRAHV